MKKTKLLLLFITILMILSCAINQVADYDRDTAFTIIKIARRVDMFYISLSEKEPDVRLYKEFVSAYNEIEIELRTLVMRNKMRTKNEESIMISEHILQNWLEFKVKHKKDDSYKNSLLDVDWSTIREQFYALAVAEAAKQ